MQMVYLRTGTRHCWAQVYGMAQQLDSLVHLLAVATLTLSLRASQVLHDDPPSLTKDEPIRDARYRVTDIFER